MLYGSFMCAKQEITSRGLDQFYHLEEACLTKKADLAAVLKLLQVLPYVYICCHQPSEGGLPGVCDRKTLHVIPGGVM